MLFGSFNRRLFVGAFPSVLVSNPVHAGLLLFQGLY